ncbi:MAG TPA: Maf family protein [Xanthobacteraceae bacterium]|nr:Maf family protein [Xanthobacteraceae bacterium]
MAFWLAPAPLILASRSAARRRLLEAAGIPIELCPADLDERALEGNAVPQSPTAVAALLAREKAAMVARAHPDRLVLGADQTLALGAKRFSKSPDRLAARAQLQALRGRTHELHAAIAFVQDGAVVFEHVETARLTMRAFSDDFLNRYLDTVGDAVLASVGGYQLEGLGVQLFESIEGDYFTILGLPILQALDFLRRQGCLAR